MGLLLIGIRLINTLVVQVNIALYHLQEIHSLLSLLVIQVI